MTLEQIDAALAKSRTDGSSEEDVALLWMARAKLVGVTVSPAHLVLVMGITDERAREIMAALSERGLIGRPGVA